MKFRWQALALVLSCTAITTILSGGNLWTFWQPLELLVAISIFAAFYIGDFGLTRISSASSSALRETAQKAFWPSIVINTGLTFSRLIEYEEFSVREIYILIGVSAISAVFSVLLLILMNSFEHTGQYSPSKNKKEDPIAIKNGQLDRNDNLTSEN